jgi:2-oxo-4-hydroxy-4-carboxy-5-ureidoimidazoline decarboxylase
VRIEEFDAMSTPETAELLRTCVRIDSWVDALLEQRPYATVAELLACARMHAATWTGEEVEGALADHPRIGGKPTAVSRAEQAGVPDDPETAARLADGNRRYEERFGRIYLVRARGRNAEEMLALLEERLANDPETELSVTKEQLTEIALLRLEEVFAA